MKLLGRGAMLGLAFAVIIAIGLTTNVIQFGIPLNAQTTGAEYYSCSFAGFLPSNSGTNYQSTTPAGSGAPAADYRPVEDLFGGTLLCPVNLPHGAVVRTVTFDLFSSTTTGLFEGVDCFMRREQVVNTFGTPRSEIMTQVGNIRVLGRTVDSNTVVGSELATIDNANYTYYLSCAIPQNETDVGIVGATIEYTQ